MLLRNWEITQMAGVNKSLNWTVQGLWVSLWALYKEGRNGLSLEKMLDCVERSVWSWEFEWRPKARYQGAISAKQYDLAELVHFRNKGNILEVTSKATVKGSVLQAWLFFAVLTLCLLNNSNKTWMLSRNFFLGKQIHPWNMRLLMADAVCEGRLKECNFL